ncbi:MAG: hypothetical protein MZV64_19930 [Ignavibacteriales bacterium]|nr:hypothetical protein [Ignavibacteriales bacterium]
MIEQGGNATVTDIDSAEFRHRHADGVASPPAAMRRGRAGDPQPGHAAPARSASRARTSPTAARPSAPAPAAAAAATW